MSACSNPHCSHDRPGLLYRCDRHDPVAWMLLTLMVACCAVPATALTVVALFSDPWWQKLISVLFGTLAAGAWYGASLVWPRS